MKKEREKSEVQRELKRRTQKLINRKEERRGKEKKLHFSLPIPPAPRI
jgi:hypothetical protein